MQSLHRYKSDQLDIAYQQRGLAPDSGAPIVIWAHGWGQDHTSFEALIKPLEAFACHIALDLPGFGESPIPFKGAKNSWGSRDYADGLIEFIKITAKDRPVIWVGHSFGVRVGVQLAAHYAHYVHTLVSIAGAGLKPKRSVFKKMHLKTKVYMYKTGRFLYRFAWFRKLCGALGVERKGGGADYQNAGAMRGVLVRVVNEHLSKEASMITCPALLFYGDKDQETPVDIGQNYNSLIKESQLYLLAGQDHYSVLTPQGCQQIIMKLKATLQNYD